MSSKSRLVEDLANGRQPNPEKPIGVKALAEFFSVPVSTVYYWVSTTDIPHFKSGRRTCFFLSEVVQYFKEKTRQERRCGPTLSVLDEPGSLTTRAVSRADSRKKE